MSKRMRWSSQAVCVNWGPPVTSPTANTPFAVVRYWSSTWMKPRASSAIPARSQPRSSVLGGRPPGAEPPRSGPVALTSRLDLPIADEARMPFDDAKAVAGARERPANALLPAPHDRLLARDHGPKVHPHRPGADTQPPRGAGH